MQIGSKEPKLYIAVVVVAVVTEVYV